MRGAAGDGRVLVVFQPHLFSRTQQLAAEMGEALALADASVVLDIYPAREDPIPGVTSALIIDAAARQGRRRHRRARQGRRPRDRRRNGEAR